MYSGRWLVTGALTVALGVGIGAVPLMRSMRSGAQEEALMAVLRADDARDGSQATLNTLIEASTSMDADVRRLAARALGRAERAEWLAHLAEMLADPVPMVRIEAVNGVGQSVFSARDVDPAFRILVGRFPLEQNPEAKGALVQTVGRLGYSTSETAGAAARAMLSAITGEADAMALEGAARGFESLGRLNARRGFTFPETVATRLRELSRIGREDEEGDPPPAQARIRRMSLAALLSTQQAPREVLQDALSDGDASVRRLAVLGATNFPDEAVRRDLIMHAPSDHSAMVRFEIIRAFSRTMMDSEGCIPLSDALGDPSPHVTLQVLDAMASCPADEVASFLIQVFASLPAPADTLVTAWQHPMRAFMTLVQVSPDIATRALNRATSHSQWQIRMYGALAAATLDQTDVLYELAGDEHHNVRTAAIQGLAATVAHEADSTYIRNLTETDYQLVMIAAQHLTGTPRSIESVAALLTALERITAERRETSRDVRVMIVGRIGELGSAEYADALRPYVTDFDVVIADSAAAILNRWTNENVTAAPEPLDHQPFPTLAELRAWENTTATLHMKGGGEIVIAFRPFDAPTNVARFINLSKAGFFDGLSFHRVVPNFVIQGGSPGANEYAGDGPYTRDEITRAGHWRGTVGLSTRGRDTGDGQIFINLVDNVRLDHNYTIFGDVIRGMEVVDVVLEGAVIQRVTIDEG